MQELGKHCQVGRPPNEVTVDYGATLDLKIILGGFEEPQLTSGKGNVWALVQRSHGPCTSLMMVALFSAALQGVADKHSNALLGTALSTLLKRTSIPKQQGGNFGGSGS